VNIDAVSEMSDAAAHATLRLAMTKRGFFDDGSFRTKRQPTSTRAAKVPGQHRR